MEWLFHGKVSAMKRRNKKRAFTLIELLVVVVIISLLAAVVGGQLFKGLGKTKRDIAKAQIAKVEGAVSRFYLDCGRYPYDSEGLDVLINPPDDVEEGKWQGRYLKPSELIDPWGNLFVYVEEGEINPGGFDLISFGVDGVEGGEGESEDVYND